MTLSLPGPWYRPERPGGSLWDTEAVCGLPKNTEQQPVVLAAVMLRSVGSVPPEGPPRQELAGYTGGDVSFLKEDFELQLNKQLILDTVSISPGACHLCFWNLIRSQFPNI